MSNRIFIAIDMPETISGSLVALDPHIQGVHWVVAEQMHLTLGFFDEVTEDVYSKLRQKLLDTHFRRFFLPIAGIATFPAKGAPKIIWIGVGNGHPHLFQIYKRVQEAALSAGLEPELRPWHPHITLARCRDVSAQQIRKFLLSNVDLGMIHVDAFHLYSSKLTPAGPIHTRELTIPCSGLPVGAEGKGG
jgi:2'-5' RNA ligase